MRAFLALLSIELVTSGLFMNPVVARAQSLASSTNSNPIRHLVVIFQENVSFDHYFGTYPHAANLPGEPPFTAAAGTPSVNGLSAGLLNNNPNLNPANGAGASNPFRLDRTQAATADQDHDYGPEQAAFHGGLMDLFPLSVGVAGPPPTSGPSIVTTPGLTMGYYDGNTVTGFWNYAQRFAMSDNSYNTTFGPSTPGAINLISGQTNGVINNVNGTGAIIAGGNGSYTDVSDADPVGDVCSTPTGEKFQMAGKNVGDLLNAAGVSWGFFEGGFDLTITNANGSTGCSRSTTSTVTGTKKADYIPHHQPFQYYASTANPLHNRPSSTAAIGYTDAANHQYDSHDFFDAVKAGNYPTVSFLKAPGYQDGHAGYSDPLDEQTFIVNTINFLQQSSGDWEHTLVVIAYDDSDGWYDHQMSPILNQSATAEDALTAPGACGTAAPALEGSVNTLVSAQGRCGYGPRLPLLVISPWAKQNFVDHTVTDQSSILRYIEDTWLGGQRIQGSFDSLAGPITNMLDFTKQNPVKFILDPSTGLVTGR